MAVGRVQDSTCVLIMLTRLLCNVRKDASGSIITKRVKLLENRKSLQEEKRSKREETVVARVVILRLGEMSA